MNNSRRMPFELVLFLLFLLILQAIHYSINRTSATGWGFFANAFLFVLALWSRYGRRD